MAKIKIVTDSTCDLPTDLVEKNQIKIVPLKVIINGEIYRDGVDLTSGDFYAKMKEAGQLPTTSQPSPGEFTTAYEELRAEGYQVISIHLSGGLSGTCQSAELAAQMVDSENITVIDSKSASIGLGILVLEAARKVSAGAAYPEIIEYINHVKESLDIFLMVDNLDNLAKGGRIGKASALLGTLLNIKPILSVEDGIVVPVEKVRGTNSALDRLIENALAIKGDKIIYALAHADARPNAEKLANKLNERIGAKDLLCVELGPVIGTHVGIGTLGIAILVVK